MAQESEHANKLRSFSELAHSSGTWSSEIKNFNHRVLNCCISVLSLKHAGIQKLSKVCPQTPLVLDCGGGKGYFALWFLTFRPNAIVCVVDWSIQALKAVPSHPGLIPVCADAHFLPFKDAVFDGEYSIDTFGHLNNLAHVLFQMYRVSKAQGEFFFHSECKDYQYRWPDTKLIQIQGSDIAAQQDGHWSLQCCSTLFYEYNKQFTIRSFYSPSGIFCWLFGYPEKYYKRFYDSRMYFFALLSFVGALLRKNNILRACIKSVNSIINYIELLLGLSAGGSCFCFCYKSFISTDLGRKHIKGTGS